MNIIIKSTSLLQCDVLFVAAGCFGVKLAVSRVSWLHMFAVTMTLRGSRLNIAVEGIID